MPKWKGKKVSNAHYFHLRRSLEYKMISDRRRWGFMYKEPKYKIGGKKNGIAIRAGMWSNYTGQ